jgi:hypothetical protein
VNSELKIGVVDGAIVVEVWYRGAAIARVEAVDGPGVQIVAAPGRRFKGEVTARLVTVDVGHS